MQDGAQSKGSGTTCCRLQPFWLQASYLLWRGDKQEMVASSVEFASLVLGNNR